MKRERHLFKDMVKKEGGMVGFGRNQRGKVNENGTIDNSSISNNNVWYVDGLRRNLLSISKIL